MIKKKFAQAHMKAAEVYAQLSTAERLKVGCVIVQNDTIIGIGYNGMPAGKGNNCEYINDAGESVTRPEVLHAETNAIAKVAKSTNSCQGSMLFVTHAPCLDCAKLIYQSGITSIYYRSQYRSDDGINFLAKCGLNVMKAVPGE